MRKAVINALLMSQLFSILALAGTVGAAPSGELVSVTYSSGNDQQIDGYLLSDQSSKTVSFTVGPKPGKVIKDLAWYDRDGNRIRAAHGDWLNKSSFSTNSEPIQGTSLNVISVSSSPYTGIYVWDRSGGSNEWRAGHSGQTFSSNNCPPLSVKDEWGLRAYPNCTDRIHQSVPITSPYVVNSDGPLVDKTINASVVALDTIYASVSVNTEEFEYTTMYGKTIIAQAIRNQFSNIEFKWAESKTKVVVSFNHYSGPESWQRGYYQDWANPGARQMWYFFNFDVTVTAKTYLYKDKQLYVVWGDVNYDITGDFDILPSNTIYYGESFTLRPKNFVIPSDCTYQYHEYRIQKDGASWIGGRTANRTSSVSFSYGTYPDVIGIGSHEVSLRITASCPTGTVDSGWIAAKTLIVRSANFSGDFDVLPPEIFIGESFQLKPKNFSFAGCTYDGHRYKIERGGSSVYTAWATSQSDVHAYSSSTYPSVIGVGTHTITLEIRTKECGTEPVATHTLVVKTGSFTGDFDVLPPEIEFREPFQLKPKNFSFNGCTYNGHRYRIERDGNTVYTSWATSQSYIHAYTYSTYPWIIGVGTHVITLEIRTVQCGTAAVATHTLVVKSPAHNHPPEFMIGFVYPHEPTKPVHQVVEGTVLHLIYIEDPAVPTPYDPDGDTLEFLGFDFTDSSDWAKTIPQKYAMYTNGYHHVVMESTGFHRVRATMRDSFGATTTRSTYIEVIPKNPIPVIEGPTEVKEGRPLPQPFSSAKSYSPVGRAIDHSRDEWGNLKEVYTTPGKEIITLHVYDSAGLKSLEPARHELTVLPDEPPVAKLDVEPYGIRGQTYYIHNKSESPDGDQIVSARYRMRYDAENNGFDDDPWVEITGNLARAVFKPDRVGKYQFDVEVCEAYGRCDDTLDDPNDWAIIDILNLAPEVSFRMEGSNPQPDLSPETIFTPNMMLDWPLTAINSTKALPGKAIRWRVEDGELRGLAGKKMENIKGYASSNDGWTSPLSDLGYGNNGLSPYRPIKEPYPPEYGAAGQPLLKPVVNAQGQSYWEAIVTDYRKFRYSTTKTHLYFTDGENFYALNKSKVGLYRYYVDYVIEEINYVEDFHDLPNGSYYDFIIELPTGNETTYYAKRRDRESDPWEFYRKHEIPPSTPYCQITTQLVLGYYWTDNAVYQFSWDRGYCTSKPGGYNQDDFYAVRVYDIKTGKFLGASYDHGITNARISSALFSTQRGKHLIVLTGTSRYYPEYRTTVYGIEALSFDRSGNLVSSKPLELISPVIYGQSFCTPGYRSISEGIDHDLYVYEYLACPAQMGGANDQTYLTKYDEHFNLVWRKPLNGKKLDYTAEILVNPFRNEVIVHSLSYDGQSAFVQTIDMTTGQEKSFNDAPYYQPRKANFGIDWSGNYYTFPEPYVRLSTSAYGNLRTLIRIDGWLQSFHYTFAPDGTQIYPHFQSGGQFVLSASNFHTYLENAVNAFYGEYVGDGLYLSLHHNQVFNAQSKVNYEQWVPWLNIGTPSDEPKVGSGMTLGQLLSETDIENHELAFSLSFEEVDADRNLAGMSFRAADAANRYALETDGEVLYLSKYVSGARTVLAQQAYPFQDETRVNFRIRAAGSRLDVYVNGAPYFSVTDDLFTSGKFGPFSDKPYVRFSAVKTKEVQPQEVVWDTAYAIWEEDSARAEVRYDNILFTDPEDDPPAGSYEWSVTHTPRFLKNQGLSSLHGRTFTSPVLEFDKVGDYTVILRAKDDPHPEHRYPDPTFEAYRKPSNEFAAVITVHRRPIADKRHEIADDGTILWFDRSHDPDRWLSSTEYSTEPTGIDYKTTRGILEKRFYYITPSGRYVAEKLVVPQEIGTYEIGMAVKDEYGAWSDYDVDYVTVTKLPEPNAPPVAAFTVNPASTYRGVTVTIESQSWDKEDGGRENLKHTYYLRNLSTGGAASVASASRTSWTKTFSTVGTFQIRLVVEDSIGQQAEAVQTVTILNRKPQADVTNPSGTSASNPTTFDVLRPAFVWEYADADGDKQTMFQVQIYRTDGTLERDTGSRSGSGTSWTPTADLPERVTMYVRVRVHDGYEWGDWSAPKYFCIETNRPPVADFDWSPKPVYEGDTVRLIDRSSDPDGDQLTHDWRITGPGGVNLNFTAKEPSFRAERPGRYPIRLVVSDGKETAQAERNLEALPLTITGEVRHTPEWREMHAAAGHEVDRDPKDFYSGEIIRVAAVIAEAPADKVTAELEAVSKSGKTIRKQVTLTAAGGQRYEGELHDKSWMSLDESIREGEYRIVFRVVYRNGVVKETSVPIRIIGNIHKHLSVHRVQ